MKNFCQTDKNTSIFYEVVHKKENKVALFVVHGMCEHHKRYDEFLKELRRNHISTIALDLRGHGLSSGRRGDIKSILDCEKDIQKIFEAIKEKYAFKKIGIFGHSIGGEIALLMCSNNQKMFDFCVASNPVVYLPEKLKFLKMLPFKNNPHIAIKKRVSESPEMLEKSLSDPLAANLFNLRTANQVFFKGIKLLNQTKQNLSCPFLLMRGGQDKLLASNEEFEKFFNSLQTKNKKFLFYENANHRLVQNEDAQKHISDMICWIKEVTKT